MLDSQEAPPLKGREKRRARREWDKLAEAHKAVAGEKMTLLASALRRELAFEFEAALARLCLAERQIEARMVAFMKNEVNDVNL
ncbi:hypothetical protein [Shimia abyssi]|uniref:Uncharacterized protein n=1 Tax=Shimia abyssi TaxID=1662395 RepID=A0A2P8F9I3_9RHOB|nr:hypothetical protein [Shimia abyssi]PSL18379.1 hypothetical protein CLV88_111125 [Shimia abyssi]